MSSIPLRVPACFWCDTILDNSAEPDSDRRVLIAKANGKIVCPADAADLKLEVWEQ